MMQRMEGTGGGMQDPLNLLRVALGSVRDGIVVTDAAGRVQTINVAAQAMTGWSSGDALGQPVETVINLHAYGSDLPIPNPAYSALASNLKCEPPGHSLLLGRVGRRLGVHTAATPLLTAEGVAEGCLLIFQDVSDALRIAERMSYLSQHDPLTGLPNRLLLVDRLEQGTRLSDRTRELLAVLFLDIDDFHQVNESFGHTAADQLLREVGYRICDALRESDTVCRLGGDEFVVLLQGVHSVANVEALVEKLLSEMARPYVIADRAISIGCSIGVSLYPQHATDGETLRRLADGAMHIAKRSGRGRCIFAGAEPPAAGGFEDMRAVVRNPAEAD
jgi:diguanylate cyclase (GGDEF)-like protein/PAS domain S-box-containing protein